MTFSNDDRIRAFLADEARRVTSTTPSLDDMVKLLAPTLAPRVGGRSRSLVLLLAASLLVTAALATAIGVGSGLLRLPSYVDVSPPEVQPAHEAVFLRLEIDGPEHEVVVVGVGTSGREREIARLPGAWVRSGSVAPMGAVSSDGLLAMPSLSGGTMRWQIHDLRNPAAQPIVVDSFGQDVEQLQGSPYFADDMRPSVFWGPTGEVVIPWYERAGDTLDYHVAFVHGRTATMRTADVPDDLWLLSRWAADGSGVYLSTGMHEPPRWVLQPDGIVRDLAPAQVGHSACRTEYASGAELSLYRDSVDRIRTDGSIDILAMVSNPTYACLSPDDAMVVFDIGIGDGSGDVTALDRRAGLIVGGDDEWMAIEGSFAGWMEVRP